MKRLRGQGYTIIEVLIVLAASSALFVVALLAFSGQQAKTEFNQTTRDMDSKLQDISNDVSAGFFSDTERGRCRRSGSGITFDNTGLGEQGTNQDCIFLGKAIQFRGTQLRTVTVAGQRQNNAGREVRTLQESSPTVAPAEYTQTYTLKYGLRVHRVITNTGEIIQGIAILSSLGNYNASGTDLVSGTQSTGLYKIGTAGPSLTPAEFDTRLQTELRDADAETDNKIAGATICLRRDNRRAAVVITDSAGGVTTRLIVDNMVGTGC